MTNGDTNVGKADILAGLRQAGLDPGETVLAHSSLSSFGRVEGGADTVIDALLEAVGPEGTVLVPTHTWDTVNAENPVYDVRETESCVGYITNVFRKRPDAKRSLHPTHSCAAIGPETQRLLSGHEKDVTPCGPHSPYQRLMDTDGQIAFLGTGLSCNTTLHAIEELACVPYPFEGFRDLYSIDYDGNRIHVPSMRHSWGFPRWFGDMGELFAENGIYATAQVGDALIEVVDAVGLKRVVAPLVAADPFFLLREDVADKARKWFEKRPQVRRKAR